MTAFSLDQQRNERARRANGVRRVNRIVDGGKLWRAGNNTAVIASALGCHESEIYNDIEAIRNAPRQFERSAR